VLDVEMLQDEKPHAVLLVQRDQAGADVVDTAAFADIGLVPWI
jgi:methionine synthase I (cobalamin-dependent)